MRDWAAVNFHFRRGELRYDIGCYWVCTRNPDLSRIKPDWASWDTCVPVDDDEIAPELLAEYIAEMGTRYNIKKLAIDNFRLALIRSALEKIGFSRKRGNIYCVRPSDIMIVQPVIDSAFTKKLLIWGNNPALRWATNNTKLVRAGRKEGTDTGNFYYAKIEAKSRKTDPFMALVASFVIENELDAGNAGFHRPTVMVC